MNIFEILLVQPLVNSLIFLYKLLGGNLGLAIIVLSLALKALLAPFTSKSLKNMQKLNELKPQIEKLKEKHKGDKQKFMQAQSDFYKSQGFNPSAGCIPQIFQLVLFYALFTVFTTILVPNLNPVEKLNNLLLPSLRFSEGQSINTNFLYLDIAKPDVVQFPGIPFALPGFVLLLAAISQVISARIAAPGIKKQEKIAKGTKTETDDMQVAMQSSMLVMLPLLTLIFGMNFPSGLALYWVVFSVVQTYQQYTISGWGGLVHEASYIRNFLLKLRNSK